MHSAGRMPRLDRQFSSRGRRHDHVRARHDEIGDLPSAQLPRAVDCGDGRATSAITRLRANAESVPSGQGSFRGDFVTGEIHASGSIACPPGNCGAVIPGGALIQNKK